ncbi:MAG TPA: fumarate hydratase, partial [Methanomassiliicoccales archaeon]|nr:fumarate hydratase [Methanomassiliicoccales archaeon]
MELERAVEDAVVDMLREAVTTIPPDVQDALRAAERAETSEVARTQLATVLLNMREAEEREQRRRQNVQVI